MDGAGKLPEWQVGTISEELKSLLRALMEQRVTVEGGGQTFRYPEVAVNFVAQAIFGRRHGHSVYRLVCLQAILASAGSGLSKALYINGAIRADSCRSWLDQLNIALSDDELKLDLGNEAQFALAVASLPGLFAFYEFLLCVFDYERLDHLLSSVQGPPSKKVIEDVSSTLNKWLYDWLEARQGKLQAHRRFRAIDKVVKGVANRSKDHRGPAALLLKQDAAMLQVWEELAQLPTDQSAGVTFLRFDLTTDSLLKYLEAVLAAQADIATTRACGIGEDWDVGDQQIEDHDVWDAAEQHGFSAKSGLSDDLKLLKLIEQQTGLKCLTGTESDLIQALDFGGENRNLFGLTRWRRQWIGQQQNLITEARRRKQNDELSSLQSDIWQQDIEAHIAKYERLDGSLTKVIESLLYVLLHHDHKSAPLVVAWWLHQQQGMDLAGVMPEQVEGVVALSCRLDHKLRMLAPDHTAIAHLLKSSEQSFKRVKRAGFGVIPKAGSPDYAAAVVAAKLLTKLAAYVKNHLSSLHHIQQDLTPEVSMLHDVLSEIYANQKEMDHV